MILESWSLGPMTAKFVDSYMCWSVSMSYHIGLCWDKVQWLPSSKVMFYPCTINNYLSGEGGVWWFLLVPILVDCPIFEEQHRTFSPKFALSLSLSLSLSLYIYIYIYVICIPHRPKQYTFQYHDVLDRFMTASNFRGYWLSYSWCETCVDGSHCQKVMPERAEMSE